MKEEKTIDSISWQVPESEYRADPALSYSMLSHYEREGFDGIKTLFDKKESPSLLFGSIVDSILTGGIEEFNERFVITDIKMPTDRAKEVADALYLEHQNVHTLDEITDTEIIAKCKELDYCAKYTDKFIAKNMHEKCDEYFRFLVLANGKQVVDREVYDMAEKAVLALRTAPQCISQYFTNDPSNYYQLKFKGDLNGVPFRCMADVIRVDYKNKIVYPIDLKTSSHSEWNFATSFIQWRYDLQARCYWRIIRQNMDKDEYFKDFELADYKFIVVNKETLTPLIWECPFTKDEDAIYLRDTLHGNKTVVLRDPNDIASELRFFLDSPEALPFEIKKDEVNNLSKFLVRKDESY